MTAPRKIAFALFGCLIASCVFLHLGSAMVAGLFSFMILDLTYRKLAPHTRKLTARWLSIFVFVLVAGIFSWLVAAFIKLAFSRLPVIIGDAIPKMDELMGRYGVDLPFENVREFRLVVLEALKENAQSLTKTGGLLTKSFFQIAVGIFAAILCFGGTPVKEEKESLYAQVSLDLAERVRLFMTGFEKVFGSQFLISLVNTTLTAAYLLIMDLPYVYFLCLTTFLLGMLPILGTLLSSALIVAAGLILSPQTAFVSLGYLIVIHKLQLFIYSHVIGFSTNMPIWQVLVGVLFGEAVMGIPGIILAPALMYYVREEMNAITYQNR